MGYDYGFEWKVQSLCIQLHNYDSIKIDIDFSRDGKKRHWLRFNHIGLRLFRVFVWSS